MFKSFFIGELRKNSIVLLSSSFFSNLTFFSMLSILALYLTKECSFSVRATGVLMLLVLLFSRIGRILLLPLLKKCPAKKSLILSTLMMAIGYFILYITKQPVFMVSAFFIMGIGYGCNSVYVRSLISNHDGKNKFVYVQLSIATNMSAAVGSVLGVYIFCKSSGSWVYLSSAITMLVSTSLTYLFLKDEDDHRYEADLLKSLYEIIRTPGVLKLFILTIFFWVVYAQIFNTLPLFVDHQLNATSYLGSLYLVNTLIIVFFSMPINRALSKYAFSQSNYFVSGFALISIGFCLIYLVPNLVTVYSAMVVWTMSEMLFIPTLNAALAGLSSGANRLHLFTLNGISIGVGEGLAMYYGSSLVAFDPKPNVSDIYLYLSLTALLFSYSSYRLCSRS